MVVRLRFRGSQPAVCLPAECPSRREATAEIRQFWEKERNKPQEGPQSRQDRWNRFMLHPIGKLAARNNTTGECWQRPNDAAWHKGSWLRRSRRHHRSGDSQSLQSGNQPLPHSHRDLGTHQVGPVCHRFVRQPCRSLESPTPISNLRPIAVMSAWWMLYESAWVQSDSFIAWRHKIGRGHNVAYIESSEQVAATVNKAWRDPDGGYVAAMDFSKAFDHMALNCRSKR